ncbi:MAG: rhamnogalacturonan lyase, partial [Prevotella sp.]|nr:rhamnogalacturonan lyase [Prevotella sp.]
MTLKKTITLLAIGQLAIGSLTAQVTPTSQMEHLDRGLVALSAGIGNFVSWRLLGTDDATTTFDLLRNGEVIAQDLTLTNYSDKTGALGATYQVVTRQRGRMTETSNPVDAWSNLYKTIQLDRPAKGEQG